MERVRINLPANFNFKTRLVIRITDVNYGGHVGNDSFLSLVQEARLQFLNHYGYTETNIENLGVIMADAAIEYKAELFYADTITISVAAINFSKAGFDLIYLIEKQETNKTTIAAKVKTGMVCFDYTTRRVALLPQQFINKINNS